jgi:hypothetical protein
MDFLVGALLHHFFVIDVVLHAAPIPGKTFRRMPHHDWWLLLDRRTFFQKLPIESPSSDERLSFPLTGYDTSRRQTLHSKI